MSKHGGIPPWSKGRLKINIHRLNIYHIFLFMHKVKNNNIISLFTNLIYETCNKDNDSTCFLKRGRYMKVIFHLK